MIVRKLLFLTTVLAVLVGCPLGVAAGGAWAGDANNGTLPPRVWLPVVMVPPLEVIYPECPYQTTLISPEDGKEVRGTVLRWKTEAPFGNVQIARDRGFKDIEVDALRRNSYDLIKFYEGTHYWRVRAACEDKKPTEKVGPWSEIRSFVFKY